jgi:hypothetical protein
VVGVSDEPVPEAEPTNEAAESTGALADADVWRYLRLGAIGLLSLLALVATVQLYTNTSAAIAEWIAPACEQVFQAAVKLVVLLLALAGLAVLARRRFAAD